MNELKRPILTLLRLSIGVLFVFSGFAKAVDTIGGAIKIEDYFMAWGFLSPDAVNIVLSFMLNMAEFMTGFMLLFNLYMPIASLLALLFMTVFTPLTLYIAIVNPVSDCGCFGDAVKLSNWVTFEKNVVILPITIILFCFRNSFKNRLSAWRKVSMLCIGILCVSLVAVEGLYNEPIIDFRPYAVGVDVKKAMEIPADAEQPEYDTEFILEKDGNQQIFNVNNYPYNDSTWVYVDTKTTVIKEGYQPAIKDFTLTDKYGNVQTDAILASTEPIFIAISPRLSDISDSSIDKLKSLSEICANNVHEFYIATASLASDMDVFENRAEAGFNFLSADETMLKTITRCNPGIIVLQNGVVVAKYHIDHLPYEQELANPMAGTLTSMQSAHSHLFLISIALAVIMIYFLINIKHKRYSK